MHALERQRARSFLIRRAMEVNKWKASDLARAVHRDGNTVRRWIKGETTPSADDLVALAEAFGLDPKYLFTPPAVPEYELDGHLQRAARAGLQSARRQAQAERGLDTPPLPPAQRESRTAG